MMKHTTTATTQRSTIYRILLWGGLLVGFGARLFRLGAESLWYDETVSVYLAQQPTMEMIAHTARDIHPPGYYLVLHLWQALTQPSLPHGLEFLYAWPSLAAGMALLPLLYALGRRWFGQRVALTALWLAALHPFAVWYSQEVRMYTVGAALCLLCLWCADKWWSERATWQLTIYAVAGAAALYVLYYAAFALIAISLIFAMRIIQEKKEQTQPSSARMLVYWGLAQIGLLALWSPWLPTFWRQVTDPPVPPWRGDVNILAALTESLRALLVGQSPPLTTTIWSIISIILIILALLYYTKSKSVTSLFLYLFAPLALILLLSVSVTPLYHVRYFFTYAAIAPLLLAVAVDVLARWRVVYAAAVVVLLAIGAWSTLEFWQNPLYRADDHRAAVQTLAAGWRPGDAILVNAGWVYPILSVYWPTATGGSIAAVPLQIQDRTRLTGYTKTNIEGPVLITTGSVDGAASLGWGLAESDFYAMPFAQATAALAQLVNDHARLWHYRLYDTVSDPTGLLRAQVEKTGTLAVDLPFPGRDFVRLQRFDLPTADSVFCPQGGSAARYADVLQLVGSDAPVAAQAGSFLYATLCWEAMINISAFPAGLRASLRLYDANDQLIAQIDDGPARGTNLWQPGERGRVALGLPVPASTAPGRYFLDLIVYDGSNGEALMPGGDDPASGQRLRLSEIDIKHE